MRSGRALALASLAALCVRCTTNDPTEQPAIVRARSGLAWSAAAPTGAPHSGHTATLLGDGRVLIAGGSGAGDTAEVFDPRTASFSTLAAKMHAKRLNHTATMLFSGKVLIVGGGDAPGDKSAELFDPTTNTFTPTGSMSIARTGHAAVRLTTGRVLVSGGAGDKDASVEIYDPSSGTFSAGPSRTTMGDGELVLLADARAMFLSQAGAEAFDLGTTSWSAVPNLQGTGYERAVARVANGGVFATWTSFALGIPGQTFYQLYDPGTNAFGPSSPPINGASAAMSGVFLPTGRLLLVGGLPTDRSNTALVWDPTSDTFATDDAMTSPHYGQSATMLGNGDVLVVGGETPTATDLRPWPGGVLPADASVALIEPRTGHVSARLHDGTVLLAGGEVRAPTAPFQIKTSAEIFDPIARTSTLTGSMTVARYRAAAVVLQSGKVLVAGGDDPTGLGGPATATADVFDPALGAFHATSSPMSIGRTRHVLTRLPSGEVLVTGGCKLPPCTAGDPSCLCPIEIFDPKSETFTKVGAALFDHAIENTVGEGAMLLPNGLVMIAGGPNVELYDPKTKTLRAGTPPTVQRAGNTLRVLPSGKAFLSGGASLANDIYDVTLEDSGASPWSGTLPLQFASAESMWAPTPVGDLVMVGGSKILGEGAGGAEERVVRFDPVATNATPAVVYDAGLTNGRQLATWSLLGTGRLMVAGGDGSSGGTPVLGPVHADAYLYSDGAFDGARPVVDSAPATAVGGATITILGSRFTSRNAETPLAFWTPDTGATVLPVTVAAFTATSISAVVPATAYYGPGWIHVVTGGLSSVSVPLAIAPGEQGAACRFDAECATGVCADGFCCDKACSDPCQACSARRKNAGDDGLCGAVTPGSDPDGKCFAQQGSTCTKDSMCANGLHCVSGVCCDAPCTGACQSCTLKDTVGTCSVDPSCVQICDGDHTLVPTGQAPTDCSPFKCATNECLKTCASVNDCVAGAVCTLDGICAAPPNVSASSETFLGCGVSRGRSRSGIAIFLLSLLGLARARRRRR